MIEKFLSIYSILVNFVEILGHLSRITEKLSVHLDDFEDNFNIINELQSAPFLHCLLD